MISLTRFTMTPSSAAYLGAGMARKLSSLARFQKLKNTRHILEIQRNQKKRRKRRMLLKSTGKMKSIFSRRILERHSTQR
jgi:hypothetical protein